jgi:Ca2+-dependent lipid-binding protein
MDKHHTGSCDPYAVVVFEEEDDGSGEAAAAAAAAKKKVGANGVDTRKAHERDKFATTVSPQSLDPVWKEKFMLKGFTTRSGATLTVNVFDHDDDDADDLVGSVTVDVPLVGSRSGERAYKLLGDDGATERGRLFLSLRWKA